MNFDFLVSFVVPVYKVRGYVGECADSFIGLSGALNKQFEVIFVDDCTPDESVSVIEERLSGSSVNSKIVRLKDNVGLGRARNEGLKRAKGKYIAFVDSDDFLDVSEYLRSVKLAEESGSDLIVLNYYRFWNDGKVKVNKKTPLLKELSDKSPFTYLSARIQLFENFNVAWNKIYRRDLIDDNDLRFSAGYYEDVPWNYCAIACAKKIQVTASPVYFYRQRAGSILNSRSKAHLALIDQQTTGLRDLKAIGADRELVETYVQLMNARNAKFLFSELGRLGFSERLKFLKKGKKFWVESKESCSEDAFEFNSLKNWPIKAGSAGLYLCILVFYFFQKSIVKGRVQFGRKAKSILYKRFFLLLPIKKKRALFESYWGKSIACNPLAISHEMNQRGYEVVWTSKEKPLDLPSQFQWVKRKSWRYWLECARCRFLINNANYPTEVIKRSGAIHVQTKHGTPLKKMGVKELRNQTNPKGRASLEYRASRWDFVVSSNRLSSKIWKESFPYDYTVIEAGYPRNDILFTDKIDISRKIRKELDISDHKKVVLYCPTFRTYGFDQKVDWGLGEKVFKECEADFVFLVRDHYLANIGFVSDEGPKNIIDVSTYRTIEELMIVSDILITDYSSAMYDYILLNQPIIQYIPDLTEYSFLRGLNFDPLLHPPGAIFEKEQDVIDALKHCLSEPDVYRPSKKFLEWLKPFDDGGATVNTVDAITGR